MPRFRTGPDFVAWQVRHAVGSRRPASRPDGRSPPRCCPRRFVSPSQTLTRIPQLARRSALEHVRRQISMHRNRSFFESTPGERRQVSVAARADSRRRSHRVDQIAPKLGHLHFYRSLDSAAAASSGQLRSHCCRSARRIVASIAWQDVRAVMHRRFSPEPGGACAAARGNLGIDRFPAKPSPTTAPRTTPLRACLHTPKDGFYHRSTVSERCALSSITMTGASTTPAQRRTTCISSDPQVAANNGTPGAIILAALGASSSGTHGRPGVERRDHVRSLDLVADKVERNRTIGSASPFASACAMCTRLFQLHPRGLRRLETGSTPPRPAPARDRAARFPAPARVAIDFAGPLAAETCSAARFRDLTESNQLELATVFRVAETPSAPPLIMPECCRCSTTITVIGRACLTPSPARPSTS